MDTLKILVVDDEARMRKLVKDFLTNKGFKRVCTINTMQTSTVICQKGKKKSPDIMLMYGKEASNRKQ